MGGGYGLLRRRWLGPLVCGLQAVRALLLGVHEGGLVEHELQRAGGRGGRRTCSDKV